MKLHYTDSVLCLCEWAMSSWIVGSSARILNLGQTNLVVTRVSPEAKIVFDGRVTGPACVDFRCRHCHLPDSTSLHCGLSLKEKKSVISVCCLAFLMDFFWRCRFQYSQREPFTDCHSVDSSSQWQKSSIMASEASLVLVFV